jgi:hypothetical protein
MGHKFLASVEGGGEAQIYRLEKDRLVSTGCVAEWAPELVATRSL